MAYYWNTHAYPYRLLFTIYNFCILRQKNNTQISKQQNLAYYRQKINST